MQISSPHVDDTVRHASCVAPFTGCFDSFSLCKTNSRWRSVCLPMKCRNYDDASIALLFPPWWLYKFPCYGGQILSFVVSVVLVEGFRQEFHLCIIRVISKGKMQ